MRLSSLFAAVALAGTPLAAQQRSITLTDEVIGRTPVSVATGMEDVNHEIYGGIYAQMVFGEAFAEPERSPGISGMWRATGTGAAYSLIGAAPFKARQSQRIVRTAAGAWGGVENSGLNRQGMSLVRGRDYDGEIWLRSDRRLSVRVSFQRSDGALYGAQTITVEPGDWRRYPLALKARATDVHARLAIETRAGGTLDLGYVYLQPGAWGRYKGLPVRADVVQAMRDQGLQAIRFGGCANSGCGDVSEYRWKAMVGDPARRPVTRGFWYPQESNGWGIFDFLRLGEAMRVEAVPSLDIDERPADVHDLMDYLYGPASTAWGGRRIADGHPAPYVQKRLQLGNENAIDDAYVAKFKALAEVIWSYDPTIRLVVGDFTYADVIKDPYRFTGGGKVASLAAHRKILELAAAHGAEVDFDVHLWTEKTKGVRAQIAALDSYAAALTKIAPRRARWKVVVFELNADAHDMTRALANAYAITALQRRPYVDVISSANALQVDGQNDNGWNQGLVFMSQSSVWVQPPWHVHRMIAESQRGEVLRADVRGADDEWVQATAFGDARGRSLHLVNAADEERTYALDFGGRWAGGVVRTTMLGPERARAVNTSHNPAAVVPTTGSLTLDAAGRATWRLPPRSFTTMRIDAPGSDPAPDRR